MTMANIDFVITVQQGGVVELLARLPEAMRNYRISRTHGVGVIKSMHVAYVLTTTTFESPGTRLFKSFRIDAETFFKDKS